MPLPTPAELPSSVLAWLMADANLGEPHKAIAPEARWIPPTGQDAVRRQVQEQLTILGWRDRRGALDREVAAALTVLARPQVEYYGWITHAGHTIGVFAGRIGREGVLAVHLPGETVWLTTVNSTRLAARLVAQTPDLPAGWGTPFTVSASAVRATRQDGRVRTATGVRVQRATPDVLRAQRLTTLPSTGHGELYTARRDNGGRRQRARQPLRYTDTSEGRFAILFTAGQDQVRVEPAGQAELVQHLERMGRTT